MIFSTGKANTFFILYPIYPTGTELVNLITNFKEGLVKNAL